MGFFSSLRLPSRTKKTNNSLQAQSSIPEIVSPNAQVELSGVKNKKGSVRWPNSFMQQKPNQRPTVIPQIPTANAHFEIFDAKLPEPKGEFLKLFQMIERRFAEQFEIAEYEPSPGSKKRRDLETQRKLIKWQEPGTTTPSFPPCLKSIPLDEETGLLQIFNLERLLDTSVALLPEVPAGISAVLYGEPIGYDMAGLEARMRQLTRSKKNIGTESSIANRDDWYRDAVFAQQSFTGPNPTSIKQAPTDWVNKFMMAAKSQAKDNMISLLRNSGAATLYIQDNSYFRNAANAAPDSTLQSDDMKRFGCASVTLYQLSQEGNLHPLAIVLDYRVGMENSVCIFNQRLTHHDPTVTESTDWPWRYAKMCAQVSDWTRHELEAHLNNCHLIEEATIVAAQRSLPSDHIVYQILEPHWLKTLSLNAAARETLVPEVISRINGFSKSQTYNFVLDAYQSFNWTANYIPNDLGSRGFPASDIDTHKYHNYAWARNMVPMWATLYKFVRSCLSTVYKTDADVAADKNIEMWCQEMQSPVGGQMSSFPMLKTIDDLSKAVTMCIHIASPQHNSINYLQCYYMSFVPNKPASLMAPLPRTLGQLMAYNEADLIRALPIQDSQVWLLSSQLPYLLSYGVAEDQTLLSYAQTLEEEAKRHDGERWKGIEKAAKNFHHDLLALSEVFLANSEEMDDRIFQYNVMDPTEMAVSILI